MLKIWAKRHRDLARARNQVACRLHAVLCELVPGGIAGGDHRSPGRPRPGRRSPPSGRPPQARHELAAEFLADLRRLDAQLRESRKKLAVGGPGLAAPA